MEHMAVLKQIGLFQGLDSMELVQVSKLVKHKRFKAGDIVLKDGEPGSSLFVVKKGEFRAFLGQGLNSAEVALFQSGASFGEVALLDHGPRSASVEAVTDGELLEFDVQAFQTLMAHSDDMKIKLLTNISTDLVTKLRRTNDTLALLL